MRRLFLLTLILAGCAAPPKGPTEQPPPAPEPPAVKENVAVAGLMQSARDDANAGRLVQAAASLARAPAPGGYRPGGKSCRPFQQLRRQRRGAAFRQPGHHRSGATPVGKTLQN